MSNTLAEEFAIRDDFPAVEYSQWREAVEKMLQGAPFDRKLVTRSYEGIDIQPLYSRRDQLGDDWFGLPGFPPFVRGAAALGCVLHGWDLRQEHAHPDLAAANEAIRQDVAGGATSLLIRLDAAARRGLDPDQDAAEDLAGRDGLAAYRAEDLGAALADVDLQQVGVALEAGAAFLPAAAMLAAVWRDRGVAPAEARGAFNGDPLAALARTGQLPVSCDRAFEALAELARWTAEQCPRVTAVAVDTGPYHDAGASATQDIAFAMATAVEYLRALTGRGMNVDTAAGQMLFRIGLGTHHFLAIAKLRAARRLWSHVIEQCGGSPATGAMRIHARTSNRVLAERDPHVNLLRNTVGVFAAGLGGAEIITSVPFDAKTGVPDEFSRRVARNTALILQEEAHLHRVLDPVGGSWFLDRLTQQLAVKAWEVFQDVERQGGMLAALESGWVAERIEEAFAPRAKDIARRKEGITGVSEFPDVHEEPVAHPPPDPRPVREAAVARIGAARREVAALQDPSERASGAAALIEAAAQGATLGQMAAALGFHAQPSRSLTPLEPRSFAQPFENLRNASDAWLAAHGRRPRVFLANMGPIAHHTARATFSKNFFEAGGFEVIPGAGFADAEAAAAAFAESQAAIAVICSSDKLYPEIVPPLARRLKEAGARTVILAGHPGENEESWRAAGVDRFIFIKCDVLATLRDLLREEGVIDEQD